ncbi:MAG: hypothetical protein U0P45_05020 [Acidimicrobiales bacterium]
MAVDEDIPARIAALEAQVASLRRELVTGRVVVMDADGVARVVLSAEGRTGSVLVRLAGPPGATTGMELVAAEPEGEEPVVAVAELRDGDVVALFDLDPVVSDETGRSW